MYLASYYLDDTDPGVVVRLACMNYYGERGARIDTSQTVFENSENGPRTWFFRFMSPLLFYMPYVYMEELERVYIDRTVDYISWRRFISNLKQDWDGSITPVRCSPAYYHHILMGLQATVLLAANVGFLAIQSVDQTGTNKSMAQIASYISATLSLFNFIVCQILGREHRHDEHQFASRAVSPEVLHHSRRLTDISRRHTSAAGKSDGSG